MCRMELRAPKYHMCVSYHYLVTNIFVVRLLDGASNSLANSFGRFLTVTAAFSGTPRGRARTPPAVFPVQRKKRKRGGHLVLKISQKVRRG